MSEEDLHDGATGMTWTKDRRTFLASSVMAFLVAIQWGLATGFLPLEVRELGGSYVDVALVFALFASFRVVFSPAWGFLSDRTGRRKVFPGVGALCIGPIFFAMAFSFNAQEVVLLRASTGIVMSAIYPIAATLVTEISYKEKVGRSLGIYAAFRELGFALAYLTGGFLAAALGYSFIWILSALVSVTGGVVFLAFATEPSSSKEIGGRPKARPASNSFSNMGDILPLCLATTLFVMGHSIMGPNFQVFFTESLGADPVAVGLILFGAVIAQTAFQPIAGNYSDKFGKRKMLAMAAAIAPLALLSLLIFGSLSTAWAAMGVLGIAEAFFFVASTAYVAEATRREERGKGMGLLNSFEAVGRASGPIIGGVIAQAYTLKTTLLSSIFFPLASLALVLLLVRSSKRSS